jgi:hypothetical protein
MLKSHLIDLHSQGMSVIIHLHSQGMSVIIHLHSQGMSVIIHLHSQGMSVNENYTHSFTLTVYTHPVSVNIFYTHIQ